MKMLSIAIAALLLASNAAAQARPNYSPDYVQQIEVNLALHRSHCTRMYEAGKRELYDDTRLIAQLRVIEAWGKDADSGKLSMGMLGKARVMGLLTPQDAKCLEDMNALIQYALTQAD